jgi:undecaprenyl-diphosphatase
VLRLAVAALALLVLLLVERLAGDTLTDFGGRFIQGLSALPSWFVDTVSVATRLAALAFLVVGFVVVLVHRRWRMLLVVAVGIAVSALVLALVDHLRSGTAPAAVALHGLVPADFPTAYGLAASAAFATAVAPWTSRRWRRSAWALVVAMTVAHFLVTPVAFTSLNALAAGWFGGAASLVLLGAPSRRATGAAVMAALGGVGVPMAELEQAKVDARGSTPYFGTTSDGRPLFVKVLGTDERSADLLFRLYRAVMPHDLGDERPFSSLRRTIEHEALVALMAPNAGVRTPRFVTMARAEPNAYVLAYEAIEGRSLDGVDEADLDDELVRSIWEQVGLLHRHGIAHRDLRLANIFRDADGQLWLIDFGFSEAAARDLLLDTDRAELVASTATRIGVPRAVTAAAAHLDAGQLALVLDRLRPWALSGATRAALKADPSLLPALRDAVQAAADAGATGATSAAPLT